MARGSKKSESEGVQFRLSREVPLIIVRCVVNGRGPFNFAVDTGASVTVISPGVARQAGVALDGARAKATGADGHMEARMARLKSLEIGKTQAKNLQVAIMGLATLNRSTRLKLGGIVGYNMLKRFRVTIDYAERKMILEPVNPERSQLAKEQGPRRRGPKPKR